MIFYTTEQAFVLFLMFFNPYPCHELVYILNGVIFSYFLKLLIFASVSLAISENAYCLPTRHYSYTDLQKAVCGTVCST